MHRWNKIGWMKIGGEAYIGFAFREFPRAFRHSSDRKQDSKRVSLTYRFIGATKRGHVLFGWVPFLKFEIFLRLKDAISSGNTQQGLLDVLSAFFPPSSPQPPSLS